MTFGQNMHFSPTREVNASTIMDDWYFAQVPKWDYQEPSLSDETDAFSQIVWNSTTHLGCGQATASGPNPGTYTVCYYDPAGNVPGLESDNVSPPIVPAASPVQAVDTNDMRSGFLGQKARNTPDVTHVIKSRMLGQRSIGQVRRSLITGSENTEKTESLIFGTLFN